MASVISLRRLAEISRLAGETCCRPFGKIIFRDRRLDRAVRPLRARRPGGIKADRHRGHDALVAHNQRSIAALNCASAVSGICYHSRS